MVPGGIPVGKFPMAGRKSHLRTTLGQVLAQEGAVGMVTIFKHHISMWSLLEMVADFMFCVLAVVLAVDRLPVSLYATQPPHHLSSVDVLVAVAFAIFMALLYSFVGLYRQRKATSLGLPLLFGRAFMALALGSFVAYAVLEASDDGRYAYPLLLFAVPFM